MSLTVEFHPLATLPEPYVQAFERETPLWPAARRQLAHDILLWLFNTPTARRAGPCEPGCEFTWRLTTVADFDAMRLAVLGARVSNRELEGVLMPTADAAKQFHARAYHLLPSAEQARLVLMAQSL